MRNRNLVVASVTVALLTGCTTLGIGTPATPPVESQLATACNGLAGLYRTAATYRAQGKLKSHQIVFLSTSEPQVMVLCDPTKPPADEAAAILQVLNMTTTLANLVNGTAAAQVKQ